jgi:hypothetical protein
MFAGTFTLQRIRCPTSAMSAGKPSPRPEERSTMVTSNSTGKLPTLIGIRDAPDILPI